MYPKTLNNLITAFKLLPGVGVKTAERYALHILDLDEHLVEGFSKSITDAKSSLKECSVCFNLTDQDVCNICSDERRNRSLICVVSNPKEVFSIEKMNQYNGLYHVLGGLISTQKGIMPGNLNIQTLIDRVNDETEEVILGLNATVEGEMTSLYIAKKLEDMTNVSRLAFGLPIGGHLDYADDMTLMKAFEGRNKIDKGE